ncbi:glycoside hydrolase family 26 protein [Brachybacterium epidermidis]|uniref:glycoside hydrolase family 26 protein n=1 Tax=Brachybacterium epidermidis TaxID=2781983 RepID=UPI00398F2A3E
MFTKSGPHDFTDTESFVRATGARPAVHEFSAGWSHGCFDRELFDRLALLGMMPLLAWEPWDYLASSPRTVQPEFQLREISGGRHDSYIQDWARGIARLDYRVAIRFAHEMNGDWYPWSERVNGNAAGDYVRAFRHVHDVVTAEGADVTWIWSPNVNYEGSAPIGALYPGSDYVDWMGLSGYYTDGQFEEFDQIFGRSIAGLEELDDKPIVITEIGAPDTTGRQSEWVVDMFDALPRYPSVIGFVWFEVKMHEDWRIAPRLLSSRLYSHGLQDPRYDTSWIPDVIHVARGH